MSPSVYSRNLNPSSLNAYHYCFKRPFGMFFMQLKGKKPLSYGRMRLFLGPNSLGSNR